MPSFRSFFAAARTPLETASSLFCSSPGDGNVNGYGLEFFLETPAGELPERTDDVPQTWQFQLLYTVSQLAAGVLPSLGASTCSTNAFVILAWNLLQAGHLYALTKAISVTATEEMLTHTPAELADA